MDHTADIAQRRATYDRLGRRNRVVGVLRIAVPALGIVTLVGLVGQLYLSSLAGRFGIGAITVTRESVVVDAPRYEGLLEDGSAYRVSATDASAAVGRTDLIQLSNASLAIDRMVGSSMSADATSATLDTTRQVVIIEGRADIADSSGTTGTVEQSEFDYRAQTLTGQGPVHIDYADGTVLDSVGMTYDAVTMVWTFSNAKVTLPSTPGSDTP